MSIAGSIVQGSGSGGAASSFVQDSEADNRIATIEINAAIAALNSVVVEGRTLWSMSKQMSDAYADESGVESTTGEYDGSNDSFGPLSSSSLLIHSNADNDSQIFFDSSANQFTVTPVGNVKHSSVQYEFSPTSIFFNGGSDALTVSDNDALDLDTSYYTISFWIRVTSFAARRSIISKFTGSAGYLVDYMTNGSLRFLRDGGGGYYDTSAGALTVDTWHHVAVVKNNGSDRIYVDGVAVFSGTFAAVSNVATDLTIGSGFSGSMSAYLQEVRIIKGSAAYTAPFTPPTVPDSDDLSFDVISESFQASTQPVSGRLIILHEDNSGSSVLNTNVKAYMSIDGGSTWEQGDLSFEIAYNDNVDILSSSIIDLSLQAGTDLKYKLESIGEMPQRFHGAVMQWQ